MSESTMPTKRTMVRRIVKAFHQANDAQRKAGTEWYSAAYTFAVGLSERYGVTVETAAGIIAALSPQTAWSLNMRNADTFVRTGDVPGLANSRAKARAILDGGAPLDVLSGPKVRAFYSNITGDFDAVTVDRHAARIAGVSRRTFTRKQYGVIADAYRSAARALDMPAAIVQAITWCTVAQGYASL